MNEIKAEIVFSIDGNVQFFGPDAGRALVMYQNRMERAHTDGKNEVIRNLVASIENLVKGI